MEQIDQNNQNNQQNGILEIFRKNQKQKVGISVAKIIFFGGLTFWALINNPPTKHNDNHDNSSNSYDIDYDKNFGYMFWLIIFSVNLLITFIFNARKMNQIIHVMNNNATSVNAQSAVDVYKISQSHKFFNIYINGWEIYGILRSFTMLDFSSVLFTYMFFFSMCNIIGFFVMMIKNFILYTSFIDYVRHNNITNPIAIITNATNNISNEQINQMISVYDNTNIYEDSRIDDDICSICTMTFANGDSIHKYRCNHIFHEECSKQWLKIKLTCPNCRSYVLHNDDQSIINQV